MADLAAEIEQLERQGSEALSSAAGVAFYADVMADDGLMVFPGSVMDKDAALAAIGGAPPWSSFSLDSVRVAGDDVAAVISYRATAQRGDAAPYVAEMSSVYVMGDGRWRLLLHQQSPG
jgi:uncharacterized protein (TIGR02246 family)